MLCLTIMHRARTPAPHGRPADLGQAAARGTCHPAHVRCNLMVPIQEAQRRIADSAYSVARPRSCSLRESLHCQTCDTTKTTLDILQCEDCGVSVCQPCVRSCARCAHYFCTVCSVPKYVCLFVSMCVHLIVLCSFDEAMDRAFCLECERDRRTDY